jgi:N-acetylglucosaminyl-diphospho-decaprenol L-rhamnosyltransferase
MKLLVVIVNYKVTDLTIDCLRSLAPEIPSVPGTRVSVCENGTGEADVQRLREVIEEEGWGDWCELTSVSPNRGFTGGNNAIIEPALASAEPPAYFYLLNADTIVRPGALRALTEFMDAHPRVGIGGTRLEDLDGTPQDSAFRFHNPVCEFERGLRLGPVSRLLARWLTVQPISSSPRRTDWVSGASLIVRREAMQQIGGLDEGYYTYFDDIDLCHTALNLGWETWYVPESRVVHYGGMTTGITTGRQEPRRPEYWFQARRRYFLKHDGPVVAALADLGFIVGFALWRLRRWLTRMPDEDPELFLLDAIRYSVFRRGFRVERVRNPLLEVEE